MDPLSALGLAAAVVQFASFAGSILSNAAEVYSSTTCASNEVVSLEQIYLRLREFSSTLGAAYQRAAGANRPEIKVKQKLPGDFNSTMQHSKQFEDDSFDTNCSLGDLGPQVPGLKDSYSSLATLLSSCHTDCHKIMAIVQRLKDKSDNKSRWSCFKVALKTAWHRDEIAELETRLQKTQQLVLLEMNQLAQIYQANQLKELAVFKEESKRLGIQQGDRLHKIESQLSTLLNRKDATVNRDSALLELSDLEKAMSRLGIAQRDISNGIEILRSLGFPSRTVRHTAIPNAHQETFDWAFKCDISPGAAGGRCSPRASTSNLLNWLQKGTGTFWVSGKPGSGKSTFMKFIASHPETTNALVAWAQPLPVTIASHYFWSQGTHMQKSQAGLIQSLLYEIFRNCPDLAQQICPARWGSDKGQPPWTMSELRSAMRAVSAYQKIARKFCFFIDGLDEYQGDHIDFCEDLRALFESPNIKLCVSSRPWNVFEDTFGENSRQKLYIHELTKNDMLKYTRHRLQQHRRWKALAARSDMTEFLIRSIVDKAKGVFLWVFIVTKLLREGLTNHDSFSDLRRRLESFPSDLEPFFKQMIQSVEPFYRHKMAESLQIALAAKEPLDALVYSFYDGEEDFSFNGSSYSYDIDDMELQNRRETVIRRLNGWCRCLLEANFLGQIDFLHRTVADYLRTREISELLDSNVTENFSPNLAICDAQIAWLAGVGFGDDPFGQDSTARKALIYASSAELENHVAKSRIDASIEKLENSIDGSVVLDLILAIPLMKHFERRVVQSPRSFAKSTTSGMMTVLQRPDTRPELWPVQIHEKLRLMIECNKTKHLYPEFNQTWEWLIVKCMPVPSTDSRTAFLDSPTEGAKPLRGPKFLATLEANLFQLFLGGGADPNLNTFRNAEAKSYIQDQSVNKRDQHIDMSSDLSAFERFVALASDVSIYEKHIAAYLAALDCFLLSGAKFGSVKTFASTHGQYQHGKTRVLFFTDIDEIMWTKPDRCDFFAQVARRVLPLAHEAKWPLENFQVELEWLFHFDPQISLPNDATPRALNHSLTRSNPIEKGDSCNKRSNEGDERPERKRRA